MAARPPPPKSGWRWPPTVAGPLEEIGRAFTAETGHTVLVSSASTGKLYAQIGQGAPFEVFLAVEVAPGPAAAQALLRLDVAGVPLLASITRKSLHALDLAPGREVYALVKGVALVT